MSPQQIAEPEALSRRRGLADDEKIEPRVVEPLEQILAAPTVAERELYPRKAIAGHRRVLRDAGKRARERAVAVLNADLGQGHEGGPAYALRFHRGRRDIRENSRAK